ncbi:MAG: alpha/beta fold hydrolase [Planctomycetota bacterium]
MRLSVLVSGVFWVFGGLLWGCQRQAMYPGAWMDAGQPLPLPPGAERWELPLPGGAVEAILLPSPTATADRPGPALIFMHGNGEFIDQWTHDFRRFTEAGFTVLLPEYRGYGPSAGKPSQPAILDDLIAFRQRLVGLETVDDARLVYLGRSLGGGFAAQLAQRHPPAALILSSTFTSAADAANDLTGLPRWLVRDKLEVRGVLENYPGPVLILHGEDDDLLGVHHARANAEAAARPQLQIYPRTGHENMPEGFGRWRDIRAFLHVHRLMPEPRTGQ